VFFCVGKGEGVKETMLFYTLTGQLQTCWEPPSETWQKPDWYLCTAFYFNVYFFFEWTLFVL